MIKCKSCNKDLNPNEPIFRLQSGWFDSDWDFWKDEAVMTHPECLDLDSLLEVLPVTKIN